MTALATMGETSLADQLIKPEFAATVQEMARQWTEDRAALAHKIEEMYEITKRMSRYFPTDREEFDIDLGYYSKTYNMRYNKRSGIEDLLDQMERRAWRILIDKMGLKNIMSIKQREQFEKQLEGGELPPLTEETILDTLFGLANQANTFATEAAKEVFDLLRPGTHWRAEDRYKTNSVFRVGRRVILGYMVSPRWGKGLGVRYGSEGTINAIDRVFKVLDGKTPLDNLYRSELCQAIDDGETETEYFRWKCFKNGNLHLEFKRLDLVTKLNGLATGEYVLGEAE